MAAATVYGAQPRGSFYGMSEIIMEFTGGGTFAAHDLVKFQGTTVGQGGEIIIAAPGANTAVVGVALEAGTDGGKNIQVNVTPGLIVTMQNDNDTNTFDGTFVGQYANIIGATGAQLVDSSSHSSTKATLMCLEYAPYGVGYDNDSTTRTTLGNYVLVGSAFVI